MTAMSSVGRIVGIVAAVVRTVCAVIAAVILVYAIFILFGANPTNGLVSFTRGFYQDFGGFTDNLFSTSNPKFGQAINVAIPAVTRRERASGGGRGGPSCVPDRRRGLQAELLHRRLAHLDLADLAGHRHRELLDDLDVAGDLVVGQPAAAEIAHGLGGERLGARAQ